MSFGKFVVRRLLQSALTLVLLITLLWGLFRLLPGDPTTVFLGGGELPAEAVEALKKSWGLDQPLPVQFFSYLGNLLSGDLGLSFSSRKPVTEVIFPAMANTLSLMVPALVIAVCLGIGIGAHLGWRRGTKLETVGVTFALVVVSIPVFWLGILLLTLFSYGLGWFPLGGMSSTLFLPESRIQELPGYDFLIHLALPLFAAALHFAVDPMMIMRTSMVDVAKEDFVTFARSTGIPDSGIRRLAKRNAILPVLTYVGIMVGFAFGGQVLLEVLFSWPGMGRVMVTAVEQRDYPVAQAAFFFMAVLVIMTNFLIDIAYSIIDPRIQLD